MPVRNIEVDGEEWTLDDNPSMGTVKYVQNLQMGIIKDRLSKESIRDLTQSDQENLSEEKIMKQFLDEQGFDGMMEMMWDRSLLGPIQTICLAADRKVTSDQVEKMGARDFKELRETAEDALGGDADDFFEELGIGTSSMQSQEQAQAMMNQKDNDLPAASRNLLQKSE